MNVYTVTQWIFKQSLSESLKSLSECLHSHSVNVYTVTQTYLDGFSLSLSLHHQTLPVNIAQTQSTSANQHQPIIKYSDDSALEDLSNSDSVYFAEAERFSNWCRDNSPDLNVKKTKEILTDLRKAPTVIQDLFTDGVKVERVLSTNI